MAGPRWSGSHPSRGLGGRWPRCARHARAGAVTARLPRARTALTIHNKPNERLAEDCVPGRRAAERAHRAVCHSREMTAWSAPGREGGVDPRDGSVGLGSRSRAANS